MSDDPKPFTFETWCKEIGESVSGGNWANFEAPHEIRAIVSRADLELTQLGDDHPFRPGRTYRFRLETDDD